MSLTRRLGSNNTSHTIIFSVDMIDMTRSGHDTNLFWLTTAYMTALSKFKYDRADMVRLLFPVWMIKG